MSLRKGKKLEKKTKKKSENLSESFDMGDTGKNFKKLRRRKTKKRETKRGMLKLFGSLGIFGPLALTT